MRDFLDFIHSLFIFKRIYKGKNVRFAQIWRNAKFSDFLRGNAIAWLPAREYDNIKANL